MWDIKNCVFLPFCYCGDTLLGVRPPAELDFQSLDENPHPWWLSLPCYYTWQEHFLSQGQYPVTLLYAPSFSFSQSLFKVVLEFCVYQDLTKSLILTFSLLPILLKKLVSCCFLDWKHSIFTWYHMQIAYLGEFLHEGPCIGYPRSAGLFLVLLVEFQMRPQIQRWSLSLLCDLFLSRSHKCVLHLSKLRTI